MTTQLTTVTDHAIAPRTQSTGMLNPQNIGEALQIADVMSKSNIVPKDYQGNPGNIVVAIQWGMELGLPPLQAMQNLAVINGRPSLWGDAVLALVRGSGLLEWITEDVTDTAATCTVKRKGEPEATRAFSIDDAKRAGLLGKQGPWAQYPKRMLQMRARSWAMRDIFPDVLKGIAVAEEVQDMPAEKPRHMGSVNRVPDPVPAAVPQEQQASAPEHVGEDRKMLHDSARAAAQRVGREAAQAALQSAGYANTRDVPDEAIPTVVDILDALEAAAEAA